MACLSPRLSVSPPMEIPSAHRGNYTELLDYYHRIKSQNASKHTRSYSLPECLNLQPSPNLEKQHPIEDPSSQKLANLVAQKGLFAKIGITLTATGVALLGLWALIKNGTLQQWGSALSSLAQKIGSAVSAPFYAIAQFIKTQAFPFFKALPSRTIQLWNSLPPEAKTVVLTVTLVVSGIMLFFCVLKKTKPVQAFIENNLTQKSKDELYEEEVAKLQTLPPEPKLEIIKAFDPNLFNEIQDSSFVLEGDNDPENSNDLNSENITGPDQERKMKTPNDLNNKKNKEIEVAFKKLFSKGLIS
jgi:hypothetical protein